ncbi:MAG: FAD-dependent oxidoreductase [Nitrososphaeria archaeon]|nr:FAD-dependent oxidoreductase [Nitrososphaeria archaeon]
MELKINIEKTSQYTGKKVAIIGGGPAGLSAAKELIQLGHEVHVYEKMCEPGGLLIFGIPSYRINKEKVRENIRKLAESGATFYTNTEVGRDILLSDIIKKYDAVLIATGAWTYKRMGVPGENLKGIYYALDYIINYNFCKLGYLKNENLPKLSGHVAVIGGGLTAVDACHIALQNNVERVYLIYRRGKWQAPAGKKIIENLEISGVHVMDFTQPIEFIGEDGVVKAIKVVKTVIEKDNGKFELKIVPDSQHLIQVDNVLIAVGLAPSIPNDGGKLNIKVEKEFRTNNEKVFIAGDALLGPSYIGFAIQSGIRVSKEIHAYLTQIQKEVEQKIDRKISTI